MSKSRKIILMICIMLMLIVTTMYFKHDNMLYCGLNTKVLELKDGKIYLKGEYLIQKGILKKTQKESINEDVPFDIKNADVFKVTDTNLTETVRADSLKKGDDVMINIYDNELEKNRIGEIGKIYAVYYQIQENVETSKTAYPPMIMIDDKLYKDTGYVNSAIKSETFDGKITNSVDGSEKPAKNNESNFGKGYGYKICDEGIVNVKINDKWEIFREVGLKAKNDIIPGVAHFKGIVIDTDENRILVRIIEVPDDYKWIFEQYKINNELKPIRADIDNLNYSLDGKTVTMEGLIDKTVEIYFDGQLNNSEPETSIPMECNQIYRIEVFAKEK